MNLSPEIIRHRAEILRHLRNHRWERTATGIELPRMKANIAGHFDRWVNNEDHDVGYNLLVNEGMDLVLVSGIVPNTFYIAPYSNNVAPTTALTHLTAPGTLGEATNYTESVRQTWVQDAEASQAVTNSGTKAVFTTNTGGYTCWGAFMITSNTKSATTGTLLAAAQFSASRSLLATDTLTLQYTVSLTSS